MARIGQAGDEGRLAAAAFADERHGIANQVGGAGVQHEAPAVREKSRERLIEEQMTYGVGAALWLRDDTDAAPVVAHEEVGYIGES
jgi:hypothetical protein